MEIGSGSEGRQGLLLAELDRVGELARQLEVEINLHLKNEQACHLALQELLATIGKSIYLAKSSDSAPPVVVGGGGGGGDSSGESFPGEASKLAFKDTRMPKKRKMLPKWTEEVRVDSSAGGIEFPIDDGHSWRKYGQKDILGAKHPRGYYRCRHRMTQSCPATKKVQRSDKDPLLFHVTYHGAHTCLEGQGQQKPQASPAAARSAQEQQPQQEMKLQRQDLLLSIQTGLGVKTEESELGTRTQTATLFFSLASPSTPNAINRPSPTFLSPTESDSTYFSICSPESGAPAAGGADMAAAAASSSYFLDMDFMMEFEQDFSSLFP